MDKFVIAIHKDGKAHTAMTAQEFAEAAKNGWVPLFTNHWDDAAPATDNK